MTLLVTNGVLAVLFSLGGFVLVRQMIGPMRVLEDHMRPAAHGSAEPISASDIPKGDSGSRKPVRRLQCPGPCRARARELRHAARRGGEAVEPRAARFRHGARDQQPARRTVQCHRHAEKARPDARRPGNLDQPDRARPGRHPRRRRGGACHLSAGAFAAPADGGRSRRRSAAPQAGAAAQAAATDCGTSHGAAPANFRSRAARSVRPCSTSSSTRPRSPPKPASFR